MDDNNKIVVKTGCKCPGSDLAISDLVSESVAGYALVKLRGVMVFHLGIINDHGRTVLTEYITLMIEHGKAEGTESSETEEIVRGSAGGSAEPVLQHGTG